MLNHLYYWTPSWMVPIIEKRKCSKCHHPVKRKDIIAIGVRELKEKQSCLYAEHQCPKCSHRAITIFNQKEQTLQQMCFTLLESIKVKKRVETALRQNEKIRNSMSDRKVKQFLKFLRGAQTHDEFMNEIGYPTEYSDDETA